MPVPSTLRLALLPVVAAAAGAASSVCYYEASRQVKEGPPAAGAAACGTFENSLNTTGWGTLSLEGSEEASDDLQHFGAGVVEGYLTAQHIFTAYLNTVEFLFKGNISMPSIEFLRNQVKWWSAQVQAAPKGDYFWAHAGALLQQFNGMQVGYDLAVKAGKAPADLPDFGLLVLNSIGDLFQIMPAVDPSRMPDFDAMSAEDLRWRVKAKGMCSALIKVTGDMSELFMAHSSWFDYLDTDRIFKHYHFKFHMPTGANRISFSSYPGYLESLDDFYMMDSGLGMVQTSNDIMDKNLFKLIHPQSLLAWQRVRIASIAAKTGAEWHALFSTHPSGTYVNQYMVVDFNQFKPGQSLSNGTLWVVEEIPGLIEGTDQTEILQRGYWPSYNIPFHPEIYKRSGYTDGRLGPDGSYTMAKRAQIFRRDQGTVVDLESFMRIMRYANYSDPIAVGEDGKVDYSAAICMRGDLDKDRTGAGGCYDTKVTSSKYGFHDLRAKIVNGPSSVASDQTHGRSGNAPFQWRPLDQPHFGLPSRYAFDFVETQPAPSLFASATIVV